MLSLSNVGTLSDCIVMVMDAFNLCCYHGWASRTCLLVGVAVVLVMAIVLRYLVLSAAGKVSTSH